MAKEMSVEIMLGVKISRKGVPCFAVGKAVLMGLEKEVRRAISSSSAIKVEVIELAPVVSWSLFRSEEGVLASCLPLREPRREL